MTKATIVVKTKRLIPPFEMWVAVLALYAALGKLFPRLSSASAAKAVELAFPHLVNFWVTLYGLGGLCMVIGLLCSSNRLEGAGLCLLGSGVTVALIATLAAGAAILPVTIANGGIVLACVVRLLTIQKKK